MNKADIVNFLTNDDDNDIKRRTAERITRDAIAELLMAIDDLVNKEECPAMLYTIFAERIDGVTKSLFWPFFDKNGRQDPSKMMMYKQDIGTEALPLAHAEKDYKATARRIVSFCDFDLGKILEAITGLMQLERWLFLDSVSEGGTR